MTPYSADQFTERVAALAAFGDQRIGPIGGGPIMPSQDVLCARELVRDASPTQLERLLASDNAAIRAHVAREIIRHRPDQLALVNLVSDDRARILVGSMNDIPPIRDRSMPIAEVVEESLSYTGLTLVPTQN